MTKSRAEIDSIISSLDLVTNTDSPARWSDACETLRTELEKGAALRRMFLPAGPVVALAAFLVFEVQNLDQRGWIVLVAAIVGTAAYIFAPVDIFRTIAGFVALLCIVGLSAFAHIPSYWVLAIAIALGVHFVASQLYPALQFEHRIRSLLVYFGYREAPSTEVNSQ